MQKIDQIFPKSHRTNILVHYDKKSSTNVIGPYNSLFGLSTIQQHSNLILMVDNTSLHQIADKTLGIQKPNFSNINTLISQVISSYTIGNRFSNNVLEYSIKSIQTNLTPYPRVSSVIPCMSPLVYHDSSFKWSSIYSQKLLLKKCYDKTGQFCNKNNQISGRNDKNIATSILARGQLDPRKLLLAARESRKKQKWVSMVPTGIKISLSNNKMTQYHLNQINKQMKNSVISLNSSIQVSNALNNLTHVFDIMYHRRPFVHYFIQDGMQQMQFMQARQNVEALQRDYQEWGHDGGCPCCGQHEDYDQDEQDNDLEQQQQEQIQEDVN